MDAALWMYLALFCIAVVLIAVYSKTGKLFRCLTFTALSGMAAVGILWVIGQLTPLEAPLTPFTLLASAVLGVPGVIAMLLLNLI